MAPPPSARVIVWLSAALLDLPLCLLAPCLLAPCLLAPCLLAPCLLAQTLRAPTDNFRQGTVRWPRGHPPGTHRPKKAPPKESTAPRERPRATAHSHDPGQGHRRGAISARAMHTSSVCEQLFDHGRDTPTREEVTPRPRGQGSTHPRPAGTRPAGTRPRRHPAPQAPGPAQATQPRLRSRPSSGRFARTAD